MKITKKEKTNQKKRLQREVKHHSYKEHNYQALRVGPKQNIVREFTIMAPASSTLSLSTDNNLEKKKRILTSQRARGQRLTHCAVLCLPLWACLSPL